MSKLNVAVVGVGGIARTHMPGWDASPHAEVIAGVDLNETVLNDWGQTFGVDRLTNDIDSVLSDPAIDIIDICTPNNYHAPIAIAALEAGKHVICEKPLAPTPADVQKMIDARDASGKMLMTAQHFRFKGNARALKRQIDKGALGDVYHARGWMLRRTNSPVTAGFVSKAQSSGGACIDIGVHILDLTLWMMGNPKPVTVSGVTRTELAMQPDAFTTWGMRRVKPEIYDVEEMAAAFVRFENGATLMLEVSWMLHHGAPKEDMQMWLYGTEGGSHWPKCEIYRSDNENMQHIDQILKLTKDKMEPHALECVEFAQAIVDGAPSPVPAEQSMQVMSILDGIYRSQETNREIVL